ncbi:MAG: hypothetical protein Q9225_001222 [Loekoesia sp. 1 TL-2023]
MPSQPTIPPLLAGHLSSLLPLGSLTLITSVLGASANWLILRHIWAALKTEALTPSADGENVKLLDALVAEDLLANQGLNLTQDGKIMFIDGLQSGLGLRGNGIKELEKSLLNTITETKSTGTKVLMFLDGIDFLLAATECRVDGLLDTIWELREHVHATIVAMSADSPLIQTQNTPLELKHAALVMSVAHQARVIWGVRELDTGSAKDVSGVLRISRGPAVEDEEDVERDEIEDKELLYFVAGDGGRRVPRPLANAITKPIPCVDVVVAVPSISKNTPALHAAIPQPKSVNVRTERATPTSNNRAIAIAHSGDVRKELTVWFSTDNWGMKAKRRKTTGTGRMRTLKAIPRKFKNGFQMGTPKGARGPTNQ